MVFLAAIIAIVVSLRPRAVCSIPSAPASMREARIRIRPHVNRRPHLPRLGFRHRRAEKVFAQAGQRTALESGLEHELHEVDALAIELRDRRPRLSGVSTCRVNCSASPGRNENISAG